MTRQGFIYEKHYIQLCNQARLHSRASANQQEMSFGAECFLCGELNGFKGQIKKTYPEIIKYLGIVIRG